MAYDDKFLEIMYNNADVLDSGGIVPYLTQCVKQRGEVNKNMDKTVIDWALEGFGNKFYAAQGIKFKGFGLLPFKAIDVVPQNYLKYPGNWWLSRGKDGDENKCYWVRGDGKVDFGSNHVVENNFGYARPVVSIEGNVKPGDILLGINKLFVVTKNTRIALCCTDIGECPASRLKDVINKWKQS